MAININKLGVRLDGWADLVEEAGDKAKEAQQALEQIARGRQMPNVFVNPAIISLSTFGNRQRPYLITEMGNGA